MYKALFDLTFNALIAVTLAAVTADVVLVRTIERNKKAILANNEILNKRDGGK